MFTLKQAEAIIFYGDSKQVNSIRNWDYTDYQALEPKESELKGFDCRYKDFVDYILRITHNIWEEKGIGIIYDTYHNKVTVHAGTINSVGIQAVISSTLQTLFSFPDRRLIGQNIIWSRHGKKGYFSSHRIMSTATNLNDSSFGKATGKKVFFRTTVDCAVENNRIYEEWLVRDNLWIVKQLGLDPVEVAVKLAAASPAKLPETMNSIGLNENMNGQFMPKIFNAQPNQTGQRCLEMFSKIYHYRLFNEVENYYTPQAVVHAICDQDLCGYQQIQGMLVSLFASFPNANFTIERITYNDRDEPNGYDIAVRWRLTGIHEGLGYFGAPSGKMVEIPGISHLTLINGLVIEEWMTYDGLDVYRQIYMDCRSMAMDPLKQDNQPGEGQSNLTAED